MNSSLISLLVSLTMGGIALVGVAGLLEGSSHGVQANRFQRQQVSGLLTVHEVLHTVVLDRDSHRLQIPFRIHRNGIIRRTDRQLNDIAKDLSRDLSPARSDAVTTLSLDLSESLRVMTIGSRSGRNIDVFGCGVNSSGELGDILDIKSWVALSLDSAAEVVAESVKRVSGGCLNVVGRLVPSMSLPPPEELGAIHAILMLVPIRRHGTYYFDRAGQFRFLGHRGANNNENQPLMGPIKGATLGLDLGTSNGQEMLIATLLVEQRTVLRERMHTRLARMPLHGLLARMPPPRRASP